MEVIFSMLLIFLQYMKKNCCNWTALYSIVMKSIQIFYEGPVIFVVTCSIIVYSSQSSWVFQ